MPAAPADTLLWSALDVPATLPAPAVVPATPFFLGANHRVVLGTQTEALRAAVTALLDIGADVSMSSTGKVRRRSGSLASHARLARCQRTDGANFLFHDTSRFVLCTLFFAQFCCTVIGHARSELQLQTWSLPAVEGFQTGLVMELRRLAGDRYAFHSTVLAFNLALAAATTAAGLGLASSVSDERVAPLGDRPSAPLGIYSASPPKSTLEEAAAVLSGLARPTSTAAFVAPPVGDAATGAAAEVRDEAAVKAIYMDNYTVIASMLDSRCDDVREEGAQRAVAALLAADSSSAVCPAACRAALRERGLSARLIKALVRTEAGSGCHSQAAMALAQMARCNDCAADMVAFGAVEVLASVIMQPCVRQTVRLRRAAAEALSVLASAADIGEKAVGCGVVGYLRLAATTCPDRTFGEAAERAASAMDPKGRVTAASAGGVDFAAMTNEARQAAYRLASGSV